LGPKPINDISGWLTLPYEDLRQMSFVSRSAAKPLRHDSDIHRDQEQTVEFGRFYDVMVDRVVYGQGKNVFQSHGSLINRLIQGGDRARYQIKLHDGGDSANPMIFYDKNVAWRIDVLEQLNDKIDKIRALQGHSGPICETMANSRVLVTERDADILFHGTDSGTDQKARIAKRWTPKCRQKRSVLLHYGSAR
jgi:RNA:NAD 2'-phosphotransferase (TPT1/KptA family)